ncbi:MAG: recombinase family protein, partial [Oscillospiraceae bacterium]|nr:recombinase family protein [Oscillospiraceae bacterium]
GLIFWLQRFRRLDTTKKEHKQRLIDSFVNAVYVYDDKLVLTFNYNEANTTVTLDEVNGSIIECSGAPKKEDTVGVLFFLVGEMLGLERPAFAKRR